MSTAYRFGVLDSAKDDEFEFFVTATVYGGVFQSRRNLPTEQDLPNEPQQPARFAHFCVISEAEMLVHQCVVVLSIAIFVLSGMPLVMHGVGLAIPGSFMLLPSTEMFFAGMFLSLVFGVVSLLVAFEYNSVTELNAHIKGGSTDSPFSLHILYSVFRGILHVLESVAHKLYSPKPTSDTNDTVLHLLFLHNAEDDHTCPSLAVV